MNMSYCRMENTYHDLVDCSENWDVESDSELIHRKKILELCKKIIMYYDEEESDD